MVQLGFITLPVSGNIVKVMFFRTKHWCVRMETKTKGGTSLRIFNLILKTHHKFIVCVCVCGEFNRINIKHDFHFSNTNQTLIQKSKHVRNIQYLLLVTQRFLCNSLTKENNRVIDVFRRDAWHAEATSNSNVCWKYETLCLFLQH